MKIEYKKSELMNEKKQKTLLLCASAALIAVTLVQAVALALLMHYAHSKHDVHFIPPKITQDFSLSNSGISEGYLRDMTHFLVQLRFNVTPNTAAFQFNELLNYLAPSLYGEIRAQLVKEVEQIKHEHLSIAFYPNSFDMDVKHLQVKVTGEMKRYVGADKMADAREIYLVQYAYDHGLLKIKNIEKVKG